jgi:hypothetical protein
MKFYTSATSALVIALLLNDAEALKVNHRLTASIMDDDKKDHAKLSKNDDDKKEELEKYMKAKAESVKKTLDDSEAEGVKKPRDPENDGMAEALRKGDTIAREQKEEEEKAMKKVEYKSKVRMVEEFKVEIEKEEPLEKKEAKKSAEQTEEDDEEKEEIEKEEAEAKKEESMTKEEKKE